MENLLAITALNRPKRYAQADRANKGVDKASILLFYILFAQSIALFKHEFNQVPIDSFDNFLSLLSRILLEHGNSILIISNSMLCLLDQLLIIICDSHLLLHLRVDILLLVLAFDHF